MKSIGLFKLFSRKEDYFFEMLDTISGNLLQISTLLNELLESTSIEKSTSLSTQISLLESYANKLYHELITELSENLMTPFDREDILALMSELNGVVDFMHGTSKKIKLYHQTQVSDTMKKLARLIYSCAIELQKAVASLRNLTNIKPLRAACIQIAAFEKQADLIFYEEMANLYKQNADSVSIIKQIEIIQNLETAIDKCKGVSKTLESICMKNN